jgi:hypothetical protein
VGEGRLWEHLRIYSGKLFIAIKEKKKRFNELSKSKRKKERNEAKQKETKRNFTNLYIMEHNDDKFTHNEIFKKFLERSRN